MTGEQLILLSSVIIAIPASVLAAVQIYERLVSKRRDGYVDVELGNGERSHEFDSVSEIERTRTDDMLKIAGRFDEKLRVEKRKSRWIIPLIVLAEFIVSYYFSSVIRERDGFSLIASVLITAIGANAIAVLAVALGIGLRLIDFDDRTQNRYLLSLQSQLNECALTSRLLLTAYRHLLREVSSKEWKGLGTLRLKAMLMTAMLRHLEHEPSQIETPAVDKRGVDIY